MMTQLAVMREMLCVFAGNELVLGVVLGNWLLLMGLGSTLGGWAHRLREPENMLAALLILTAVLPPAQIVALRGLRSAFFPPGAALSVGQTFVSSLLVLLPCCLAAGFALTLACVILSSRGDRHSPGRVYFADSLGGIAGGVLFTFVLVHWLDHFALLCVPALLNLAAAGWLVWPATSRAVATGSADSGGPAPGTASRSAILATVCFLGTGLLALVLFADPDAASTSIQFPGQHVLFHKNSPYGRLVVTESGGQLNFIENGVATASTPDIEQAEETAHYAMVQRPGARRVLLISGILSGAPREILRYNVRELHCVEMDPLVIAAGRRFLPETFSDPRLRVYATDARQFVRRIRTLFDVVIVALPDPSTAQINRFYTSEFFDEARRILAPGGVVMFSTGRYENYISPGLADLLACARRTAAHSFKNVALVPGGRVYFLASDGPLDLRIAAMLEQLRLKTWLVNRNYLDAMLAPDRIADVRRAADRPSVINRDFSPALYLLHLRHWAGQFQSGTGVLQIGLLLAFAVYLAGLRGEALILFASGFSGTAIELVLLLGIQVLAGSLYQQVGLIVTLFMAGLAIGAHVMNRVMPGAGRKTLALLTLAIAMLSMALPLALMLPALNGWRSNETAVLVVISLFTLGLATLVGAQFPLAARLDPGTAGTAASRLFTADFAGACLGALLTSTLLVPVLGVVGACLLTAALNLAAGGLYFWRKKSA